MEGTQFILFGTCIVLAARALTIAMNDGGGTDADA